MSDDDPTGTDPSTSSSSDSGMTTPEHPDTDVDGHAAKKHGDYFMDVNDPQSAVRYYQEALDKGDLDQTEQDKVHYNMASAYYRLGDQTNCYNHAYYGSLSQDSQVSSYSLKFFFWAATGQKAVGTD